MLLKALENETHGFHSAGESRVCATSMPICNSRGSTCVQREHKTCLLMNFFRCDVITIVLGLEEYASSTFASGSCSAFYDIYDNGHEMGEVLERFQHD